MAEWPVDPRVSESASAREKGVGHSLVFLNHPPSTIRHPRVRKEAIFSVDNDQAVSIMTMESKI